MDLLEGIETRRSFRAFKSTPIAKEMLEAILRVAGKSPSCNNTQPWEVAVVCGNKKEELSRILCELANSGATPNPDIPLPDKWPLELEKRAKEHGARRFEALGIERANEQQRKELRLRNFEFYGAPCVLFLFMDKTLGSWSIFDMGLFAQSIILAAHSLTLGTCLQGSITNYPEAVRKFLGIPESKKLIVGISIGYPDLESRVNTYLSKRIGFDNFTQWYC